VKNGVGPGWNHMEWPLYIILYYREKLLVFYTPTFNF